ncbi:serine/threonine-protein kinase [Streptomyces mashuensis]|uniref:serine/threonine-protein kinase n=1 Tax=Streptomyces mashuensis TaxID=33904 RepID=UPI00167DA76C|nr:serine/threonine-protein kinase [Streptomyces mashuensis]
MQGTGRLIAGRYRLAERIGRGGMGTVWRADDELLGRQVAVKCLHVSPGLADDELATLYERTRREARSAARINHPNVVVVHDVVEDEGQPCIVMEYVPSTTLADVLRRGPVTPAEAARIGRGMIAALRAAHAAGVLHRDVKPGNVLLGHDGRVVLTDFGIAWSTGTSTLTKTGEMVGSIDYIAPERVKGVKPGPASDLWALGATLYQAVEGQPPFRRDTPVETAYAIAVDPVVPPRHAGPLTRLVETLLAKDPYLRPPAELVEQILREPAAEPDTAHLDLLPAGTGSGAGTDGAEADVAAAPPVTPTAPTVPTVPTAPTAPTVEAYPRPAPTTPTPTTAPAPARTDGTADSPGGRRRGRAALWGTAVAVVAAVLAVGAYAGLGDDGRDDQAAPHQDASPTPHASSAPPSPPAPPKGYHLVEEKRLGVSFPVPDGWTRKEKKETEDVEATYVDKTGLVGITVNVLDFAGSDPVRHFQDLETRKERDLPGYDQKRLQGTRFRGEPAAIWEFTFRGRAREFRAVDLGFGREGEKEYAVYLSAPSAEWGRYSRVFDVVRDGFRRGPDGH